MKSKNKHMIIIGSILMLVMAAMAVWGYANQAQPSKRNESIQEYVIGAPGIVGSVDIAQWGEHEAYDIGADRKGYAVFKDPEKAFARMKLDYATGIEAIRKEFGLRSLSLKNYEQYGTYGWQISGTKDAAAVEQARAVTAFMDIFENSFAD